MSGERNVIKQLQQIEREGGEGELALGRGKALHVSSLDKPFFPKAGYTKGDVMRYYTLMSPMLLPIIKDRPLILKRYPNGIDGPFFFQQNAGKSTPPGVRTAMITAATGARTERLVGGDLSTLLYTVQIGTIAVHTWQARIKTRQYADTTTIDLDPGEDVPFREVITVAKYVKAELDKMMLVAALKTSGSSGLHIVLSLPPRTVFEEAALVAERVAERVVEAHPDRATIERSIKARPSHTTYVDAQQNAEGKSVVAAYSLRERPKATVSAPLEWNELRATVRLEQFTIETMPARVRKVGDLWSAALRNRNTRRAIDRVLGKQSRST